MTLSNFSSFSNSIRSYYYLNINVYKSKYYNYYVLTNYSKAFLKYEAKSTILIIYLIAINLFSNYYSNAIYNY